MANSHRVLLTGANGHIGRAVAAHLHGSGWEVVGISRVGENPIDISSPPFVRKMIETVAPCEAIVHAAAVITKDPNDTAVSLVNCLGTQQVLDLARRWGVKSLVYFSSVQVVGRPQTLPVTEEHPLSPPTTYHASKVFGEYLLSLLRTEGVAASALRMTSPIGPGLPGGRLFSVFVGQALRGEPLTLSGRGTRQQDYIDARDAAAAVLTCLQVQASGVFNLGSGHSVSNQQLAETCMRVAGSKSRITFDGTADPEEGMIWQVSVEKLRGLGWQPRFSLEESIQAFAETYAFGAHQ